MRIENSFIPVSGVGEATERKLWANGITHWDEFEAGVAGSTLDARIGRFIDDARDRLGRGDLAYFAGALPSASRWRLYGNAADDACFLDIETTGLDANRHDVTTVSVHCAGETTTLVRGRDLTAERLGALLEPASMLVTFNGKRFDVPFLETCYDVDVSLPHVDLMYPCRRLGLDGGLKRIEGEVGIDRDRPDLSGRDAVRLWHQYERGDDAALDTLVSYNRADTVNLERLMDLVADRLHRDVFESVVAGRPDGSV